MSKIKDMVEYHKNLSKKGLFSLYQQAKFVHLLNQNIKKYLKDEVDEAETIQFYIDLLFYYLENGMIDLKRLTEREQNPFTDFIVDCQETQIHHSKYANYYIDRLIEYGDNILPLYVNDILENCSAPGFKLNPKN
jgi:hypothetical protein